MLFGTHAVFPWCVMSFSCFASVDYCRKYVPTSEGRTNIGRTYQYRKDVPISEGRTNIRRTYQYRKDVSISEGRTNIGRTYQLRYQDTDLSGYNIRRTVTPIPNKTGRNVTNGCQGALCVVSFSATRGVVVGCIRGMNAALWHSRRRIAQIQTFDKVFLLYVDVYARPIRYNWWQR